MLKNSIARMLAVAVAAPALALTMSTSASAAGNTVSWQNDQTRKCLNWGNDAFGNYRLDPPGNCDRSTHGWSQWKETSVDGKYWTFRPDDTVNGHQVNMCLTSYNTLVYLETCQDGNWWQQWEEVRTGNGWKLRHRGDGWVQGFYLDSDGSRTYTEPGNDGQYQLWH
ncbi:hypothetical protein [Streptomyces collinus]|uniref:Uncharacterized protein n=1 Tax=Streptomyces collinus (strain DSM 40733 / Tue 365) TaxID=1214242 RepID=S5VD55_STRC3|nr:hypothetical protein [Streptomyces collinus]AGS68442.1 hypothetical protein B446_08090 [Streptomyces collinus Tu 365]UJA07080.1 hypothetical protein HGI10_09750 [Streptomyces collinus]UJA18055.1 hypothetical protein HGI09_54360 [Streptomyces collinus]